jgi:hypothetical protein
MHADTVEPEFDVGVLGCFPSQLPEASGRSFRVATYNILAEQYTAQEYCQKVCIWQKCDPGVLTIDKDISCRMVERCGVASPKLKCTVQDPQQTTTHSSRGLRAVLCLFVYISQWIIQQRFPMEVTAYRTSPSFQQYSAKYGSTILEASCHHLSSTRRLGPC